MLFAGVVASAVNAERVLCFGDSITQGTYIDGKYELNNSWVNILEECSGGTLVAINAGRSGRKTSDRNELSGQIERTKNIDRVLFFLGVNDLRVARESILENCVSNTAWMVEKARAEYGDPKITIMSSPGLVVGSVSGRFHKKGYDEKEQIMLGKLRGKYREYAEKSNCHFLDLWGVVSPKNYSDGLHPDLAGQKQIAECVWIDYVNDGGPIKVACVGDSITFGSAIKERVKKCYPARLQKMLGEKYIVRNFGKSARTLLKQGDHPYWREKIYRDALAFNPNYVIIKLGTNDVKPRNWKHKYEFKSDLKELASSFSSLPTRPEVFLSFPVPVEKSKWGITDKKVSKELIPLIREVAEETGLPIIDFYSAVPAGEGLFAADGVHPNAGGAGKIAETVYQHLRERSVNDKIVKLGE